MAGQKATKKKKKKKDTHTTTDFSTLRENAAKKNHKGMIKTKVISKQPGEKKSYKRLKRAWTKQTQKMLPNNYKYFHD